MTCILTIQVLELDSAKVYSSSCFKFPVVPKCELVFCRRVHISSVTLEYLKGSYKVEPGDGQSRDSYLKEHGVVTFLVINPKVRRTHQSQGHILEWKYLYGS